MKRYEATGMKLAGGRVAGRFWIGLGREEANVEELQLLGSGPSLVEALEDALHRAIEVEENWRQCLTMGAPASIVRDNS